VTETILDVHQLRKHYPVGQGWMPGAKRQTVKAVDDITFTLARGETLAIVGESGCGKSTLGRAILRFTDVTSGTVWLDGHRINDMRGRFLRRLRKQMQVVHQDPSASLSPRMTIRDIIAEPLRNFGVAGARADIDRRVAELLTWVGLPPEVANRYPHAFSGGQRQRIAIARALAPEPNLLICDEAVSALDVSSKAQIVNLLADLQQRLGLAMLFISHDLAVVEHIADRVAVMYLGRIVEIADRESLFTKPTHPYTQALLSAVLDPTPNAPRRRISLAGDVPSPIDPPSGCHFHTRCPYAFERCRVEAPTLDARSPTQSAACHHGELPSIQ
jgi:peptide/nickel transport system ATP-binding protein